MSRDPIPSYQRRLAAKPPPPKPPAPPLIAASGNVKLDVVSDCINRAAAPFQNAPDPARGALGQVEHGIGAVMGVVGAPFELLDTGFAMITAPLASLMPGLPAATLFMPHFGPPHAHLHPPSFIPPAAPVPLPSIGTILAAGAVNVLIGGVPAARAGDVGLAPTCGGLAPAFDIFTGSSNTWIAGSRAARMSDITWHCNPASAMNMLGKAMGAIGVVAGAVSAGASAAAGAAAAAAAAAAQAAADAAALAMSALLGKDPGIPPTIGSIMMGHPLVLIGGFPMPDVLSALGGIMKGLKMLGKAVGSSKAFGKALKKVGLCNSPGEPVNPFSGEVYNDMEDYVASDTGLSWERHYRSGWNDQDGPVGYGHRHFFQRTLTLLRKRAVYETHDNERVGLEKLEDGSFAPVDGFALSTPDGRRYELRTDRDELLVYQLVPTVPATGRLERYKTDELDVYLYYDSQGRLDALSEFSTGVSVETRFVYGPDGHVGEVRRGVRNQPAQIVARYAYDQGCLVEYHDALGAVTRYRYDGDRRMVRATGPGGYSFHWHYDGNGRCIKSYGDDGLWGIEASYEGSSSVFTEPDGGRWTFKHYPDGAISHIVGPDGGVTEYVQDDKGRIVMQIMPGGDEYTWLYDESGKHYGRLDPFGHQLPPEDEEPNPRPLAHDGPVTPKDYLCGRPLAKLGTLLRGLPAHVSAALRTHAEVAPAALGPPIRNARGHIVQRPEPDGAVRTFAYDADGNTVGEHLGPPGAAHKPRGPGERGGWRTREYASWNLLAAETSPLGNTTRYQYSHRGSWRSIVDPNGNRTDYVRDQRHRIHEIYRFGGLYRRYLYDAFDAVIEEHDGEGKTLVKYETGPQGLHVSSQLASGENYTYEYDTSGRLTLASSSEHEIEQRYVGSRVEVDQRDGKGVLHGYGPDLLLTYTTYFQRFHVRYEHGVDSQLRVTTPDGVLHTWWKNDEAVVRQNGNGTSEALAFDSAGRLAARACWRSAQAAANPFWSTAYRYTSAGELLGAVVNQQEGVHYEYDADHRLLAQRDQRGPRRYAYDLVGNLVATPHHRLVKYNEGNLLAHADFEHFYYDARRRLARRDHSGGRITEYFYDSLDQLVEVRFSDREEVWRAAYDGLGRRLWREYAGERTDFYWDGDRLAAERFPDGKIRLYVYGNEDALVPFLWLDYASEDAEPKSGKAFYLYTAPTGMPLRVEDARGNEIWQARAVDAYGLLDETDPDCPTRLRFAGHFHDEHLGLFYNRFRDYDPGLGRYLQPDPLGHAGGINLFAYASNPLVDVDLRGLSIHKGRKKKKATGDDGPGKPKKERDGEEEGLPEVPAVKKPKVEFSDAEKARVGKALEKFGNGEQGQSIKTIRIKDRSFEEIDAELAGPGGWRKDPATGKLVSSDGKWTKTEEPQTMNPATKQPLKQPFNQVFYENEDGGVVRLKPQGMPDAPHEHMKQPHGTTYVKNDPSGPRSWDNEAFKADGDRPLPKSPNEINFPEGMDDAAKEKFIQENWKEPTHAPLKPSS